MQGQQREKMQAFQAAAVSDAACPEECPDPAKKILAVL